MKPSNNNQITQDRASDFGVYGGEDENGFTHGMTVNWDRDEDVLQAEIKRKSFWTL